VWFAKWVDRLIDIAAAHPDYNTTSEMRATLEYFNGARDAYRRLADSFAASNGQPRPRPY
jgi:hypothetical protein